MWSCVSFNILQPTITYMKYQESRPPKKPDSEISSVNPVVSQVCCVESEKTRRCQLRLREFHNENPTFWGEVKWAMGRSDLPRNNFESTSAMINQWWSQMYGIQSQY